MFHCKRCRGFLSFNEASHFTCTCLSLYTSLHTIYIHFHTYDHMNTYTGHSWSHLLNGSHSSSPSDYYHLSDTRVYCFYMYHVTAYYCRAPRSRARLGNLDVAPVACCSLGPENVKCMSRFWPPGPPPAILAHVIFICYWV